MHADMIHGWQVFIVLIVINFHADEDWLHFANALDNYCFKDKKIAKIALPRDRAASLISLVPTKKAISARAVISSSARKKGCFLLSMDRRITPADQISIAKNNTNILRNTVCYTITYSSLYWKEKNIKSFQQKVI